MEPAVLALTLSGVTLGITLVSALVKLLEAHASSSLRRFYSEENLEFVDIEKLSSQQAENIVDEYLRVTSVRKTGWSAHPPAISPANSDDESLG